MRLIGDADEEQQREQAQSRDAFCLPVSPAFCGSLVLYRHCKRSEAIQSVRVLDCFVGRWPPRNDASRAAS